MRKPPKWTKSWLTQEYCDTKKSLSIIAKEQGTNIAAVKRALVYHRIPKPNFI